jgi:hypothetical protein
MTKPNAAPIIKLKNKLGCLLFILILDELKKAGKLILIISIENNPKKIQSKPTDKGKRGLINI